jgi:ubiquinone/menaquinone biosynthesis C-methylase UbiE
MYEYRGLMAASWDLFRGDTRAWPDRFFYKEAVDRFGQPVLDVGCGTGRLLLDLLADGIDADGVDNSPEMLELCRRKAAASGLQPRLYEQAMESLELPRPYRTILVPSSSFQLVTDRADAREAMRRFAAHLRPAGVLVMPFLIDWQTGDPLETGWRVREQVRPDDGRLVRRRSRARYDPVEQLEHTEDVYEVVEGEEIVASEHHRRSPAVRWYTQDQAASVYREAGLVEITLRSEFTWEPARPADRIFTATGRRAGA